MSESLRVFSTCKRCKRALKNPIAQERGYGEICYKKHLAEAALKNGLAYGEHGQESLTFYMI